MFTEFKGVCMMPFSYVSHLYCPKCKKEYSPKENINYVNVVHLY